MRSGTGRPRTSLQPGMQPDAAEVEEAHVHRHLHRHGERHQAATELGGAVAGRQLARHALGLARVDGEHVPVERAVGRRARPARAARSPRRRTGRGSPARCPRAWCPACSPVSSLMRDELFGRGPAAGHRLAVAVAVRGRLREREAERARLERAAELGAHLGDLLGRGLAADGVGAHHVAADRAVTDEEAGVHRDPALEAVEELAEGLPLPVDAVLERGERHALDPGHHPAQVVGVAVVQRREREAAVAADHGGDAVHARRARGGVPHELRVVVRVRVDEAGCDARGRSPSITTAASSSIVPDRDDAAVGDADVGDHARRPGAVDDGRRP